MAGPFSFLALKPPVVGITKLQEGPIRQSLIRSQAKFIQKCEKSAPFHQTVLVDPQADLQIEKVAEVKTLALETA